MKMLMCSVFDKGVSAYMQPFFCRTNAEAIRSFSDAVGKSDTPFCTHPEDYVLMHVGVWDDEKGDLASLASGPVKLITALECVAAPGVTPEYTPFPNAKVVR